MLSRQAAPGGPIVIPAVLLFCVLSASQPAFADIYRWDNGQLIPGTQGITPGPGIDLSNWDAPSQQLEYANFSVLDLTGANFASSDLANSDFHGATLTDASLFAATLADANLAETNLTNVDFGSNTPVGGGATLSGADLSSANLTYAAIWGANVSGANFTGAVVTGTSFYNLTGFTADQLYSTAGYQANSLIRLVIGADGSNDQTDLTGWNFANQNLTSASFFGTNLTNASFAHANLAQAYFTADLANTDFNGASVNGTAFSYVTGFTAAQLYSTASYQAFDLTGVALRGIDLTGWNFASQTITNADFSYTTGFTAAQLYSTASYQAQNLSGINLSGNDLTGWNFASQNLTSATLSYGTLASANFSNANLTNAYLSGTNFASASFASANLTGANLTGSTLTNANFTSATITGANFGSTTGFVPSQLYNTASYQARNLVGISLSGNDLTGWNFASQNLTSAGFYGSTLTNANFTSATVRWANFQLAIGFSAAQLYSTASYQSHDLTGIDAGFNDLTGWDFSSENLTAADLTSVNLTSANLTSASLTSTNLSGADMQSANLTSADLSLADLRGAENFSPAASTILRGTILTDGTVQPFSLNSGETFYVRAGTPVSLTGGINIATGATVFIDSGVAVTSAAALVITDGATLHVQGSLAATGTAVTLNGGTLNGYGTISGAVVAGTGPHTIAPSAGLPPTSTGTLSLSSLATNANTTLAFNLIAPGTVSMNDQIDIIDADGLILNGGTIQVANTTTGPGSLGYYKILQYTGTIGGAGVGSFALPAIINNVAYVLDSTHDAGFIDVHRGLLGDANDDGLVNFADFVLLSNNFGTSNGGWGSADFNNDGTTNFSDFVILSNNFGATIGSNEMATGAISGVPEPTSLLMLAAGFVSAFCGRRRRIRAFTAYQE